MRTLPLGSTGRCARYLALLVASVLWWTAAGHVQAVDLTEGEVRAAVETWVRSETPDARPGAIVQRMEPHFEGGRLVAYIARLEGGGFCLAGGSELLLPVYFYSPRGAYDPTDPNLQFILWEMGERLEYLEEAQAAGSAELATYEDALADRASQWLALKSGLVLEHTTPLEAVAAPAVMELGVTSTWDQNSPYNDQCPNLTPGRDERVVVGCNGTAIAQIMKYWRWPTTGSGTFSVTYFWRFRTTWDSEPLAVNPNIPVGWTTDGRLNWSSGTLFMNGYWDASLYAAAQRINTATAFQTALQALYNRLTQQSTVVTANFGAATYDWGVLQDDHADPVDDGDGEAAEVSLHAAVAADTGFGVRWSGSDLWRFPGNPGPLEQYLRYDRDVAYGNPLDPNNMVSEIQWLRPVAMGGSSPTLGGHAWVVYGYDLTASPARYKMNMGWGGADGWFTLDNVPSGLNDNHNYLYRIAPQGVVRFVGSTTTGDGSPAQPFQNIEQAVSQAPNQTTLIFKAGSDNTFAATTLTLNRPMTLKGKDVIIRKQ